MVCFGLLDLFGWIVIFLFPPHTPGFFVCWLFFCVCVVGLGFVTFGLFVCCCGVANYGAEILA